MKKNLLIMAFFTGIVMNVQSHKLVAFEDGFRNFYGTVENNSTIHLKWNAATEKWQAEWSVSALMWGGTSTTPENKTTAVSYGVMVGAFNNLVNVGVALNDGKPIAVFGIGIPLNNYIASLERDRTRRILGQPGEDGIELMGVDRPTNRPGCQSKRSL